MTGPRVWRWARVLMCSFAALVTAVHVNGSVGLMDALMVWAMSVYFVACEIGEAAKEELADLERSR